MSSKLQKTSREIEQAKARIAELQALLPGLERQRTDLENTEIVRLVRSANIELGDLGAFLRTIRPGANSTPIQTGKNLIDTEDGGDE